MNALNALLSPAVDFIQHSPGLVLIIVAGVFLLLLVLTLVLLIQVVGIKRRQARLLRGADGKNIESMLLESTDAMHALRDDVARARASGDTNASDLRQCLQKVGIVRFDAFADIGGRQSFAAALLDGQSNGLVISGLYSRHDMRLYAKPVNAGVSAMPLTAEEKKAIAMAQVGGPGVEDGGDNAARPLSRQAGVTAQGY